jgi:hypothetical protein
MKTIETNIFEVSILRTLKTATGFLNAIFIFTLLALPVCPGFSQEAGRQPAQGQQPAAQGQTQPAQGQTQAEQGRQQPAQGQTQPAQGQTQAAQGRQQPAQGQTQPAQGQQQPAQNERQTPQEGQRSLLDRQQDANPDDAIFIVDVNPLMWIFSGIPDENNNRSVFFDVGLQFNMLPGISLRFNPSVSFGFTSESAFADSHINFVEVELPVTFICFPFSKSDYLWPVFFGVSILNAYHDIMDGDNAGLIVSVGAMLEIGYQMKLSNHLAITPSIGISRMFPKSKDSDLYEAPNFNLYSPWPKDTPVAPRIRITIGYWL